MAAKRARSFPNRGWIATIGIVILAVVLHLSFNRRLQVHLIQSVRLKLGGRPDDVGFRITVDGLPADAQKMFRKNGFVVLGDVEAKNLREAYLRTSHNFISSDAVLYVFHCLFRGGLTEYEKQQLLPLTKRLVSAGLKAAERDWQRLRGDAVLKEPLRRNVVFFAVAASLLDLTVPQSVRSDVGAITARIMAAREPGFYPDEDFTTYLPRGAYAADASLARYFQVMRWLSRQILPVIRGKADTPQEADIKLRQALLLGRLVTDNDDLHKDWLKLYDDVGFLNGRPDSFTPCELVQIARRLGLHGYDTATLVALRKEFEKEVYPCSRIVSIPQRGVDDAPRKYVQFMGERYAPDSQITQETCYPWVSGRTVPRGLDVAYALFSSPNALTYLTPDVRRFSRLHEQLVHLNRQFANYGRGQHQKSVYAGWVKAIRAAGTPAHSPHLPRALSTAAWQDKCLNTQLVAWTQMRHDFVLYAKQSVGPAGGGPDVFVEPVPETYRILAELSSRLAKRGMVGFDDFSKLCHNLEKVSQAEIAGDDWQDKVEDDLRFYISSFGQWLCRYFATHIAEEHPCIVVDVATDSNSPNPVLHEATGPFNLILIEDARAGQPRIEYRGWVCSYYEFTRNNFQRLTDNDWEHMVYLGKNLKCRPSWTRSYVYGG